MDILFLGTGAADWEEDPPNVEGVRRMTSTLLDKSLLIDVGPASFKFFEFLGKDAKEITDIILTHSHEDHLSFDDLEKFLAAATGKIRFWCEEGAKRKFEGKSLPNLEICTVTPFEEIEICGYKVMPLPANHFEEDVDEKPLHYIFEKDGKKTFYGCDGGWFLAKTWRYLREQSLDCVILDCTSGDFTDDLRLGTHNNIPMVLMLTEAMRKRGILKQDSKVVASHLAKTLHTPHEETAKMLSKHGIITAYDGLVLAV